MINGKIIDTAYFVYLNKSISVKFSVLIYDIPDYFEDVLEIKVKQGHIHCDRVPHPPFG